MKTQWLDSVPRAASRMLGYVPQYPSFPRDFPMALLGEPRILIVDEPRANIDQRLEGEIFDLFKLLKLLKLLNAGMTILVVSHDLACISRYLSRVACINRSLVCHRIHINCSRSN